MSTNYAEVKKNKEGRLILYTPDESGNTEGRVSKQYIAFLNQVEKLNWGWFEIQNGKIADELPGMNLILDSLRTCSSKQIYVKEISGYIFIYSNGKVINKLN